MERQLINKLENGYIYVHVEKIKELIKNKKIDHDHLADTKMDKYGNEFKLKTLELEELPKYIQNNNAYRIRRFKKYKSIHHLEPFTSIPMIGTNIKKTKDNKKTITEN